MGEALSYFTLRRVVWMGGGATALGYGSHVSPLILTGFGAIKKMYEILGRPLVLLLDEEAADNIGA